MLVFIPTILFTNYTTSFQSNTYTYFIMGFSYQDNAVVFPFKAPEGCVFVAGVFEVKELCISDGEDPDGKNQVGDQHLFTAAEPEITFRIGRHPTQEVALFWNTHIKANNCTFGHLADELNFAFIGTLTLNVQWRRLSDYTFTLTFADVGLAQGRSDKVNNWWFGGVHCQWDTVSKHSVAATGNDTLNYPDSPFWNWTARFRRGGNDINEIQIESLAPDPFSLQDLDAAYVGEHARDVFQTRNRAAALGIQAAGNSTYAPPFVPYLSNDEKAALRLFTVARGQLPAILVQRDAASGKVTPFDTSLGDATHNGQRAAIFVVDADGAIYASPQYHPYLFAHSSLLAGQGAAAAGLLVARDGVIQSVAHGCDRYKFGAGDFRASRHMVEALMRIGYTASVRFD